MELYLDLCCPFAKKMFLNVVANVIPKYEGKVHWIVHNVAQPWHPQSSYMHEASLAVLDVAGPAKFWDFFGAVYERQENFYDQQVYEKTRLQVYQELADIAGEVGVSKDAVMAKLKLSGTGNSGNAVTQRLKWQTRYHRTRGVHVTPTVHLNGQDAGLSSGTTPEEWKVLLDYHLSQGR